MRSYVRRLAVIAFVFGVVVVAGVALAQHDTVRTVEVAPYPSGAFAVTIEVAPVDDQDGVYTCTGEISDLESGEVVSQPTITFNAGQPASMQSGVMASDGRSSLHQVKITVSVDGEGRTASYSAEITRAGKVVSSQKASIRLR